MPKIPITTGSLNVIPPVVVTCWLPRLVDPPALVVMDVSGVTVRPDIAVESFFKAIQRKKTLSVVGKELVPPPSNWRGST